MAKPKEHIKEPMLVKSLLLVKLGAQPLHSLVTSEIPYIRLLTHPGEKLFICKSCKCGGAFLLAGNLVKHPAEPHVQFVVVCIDLIAESTLVKSLYIR